MTGFRCWGMILVFAARFYPALSQPVPEDSVLISFRMLDRINKSAVSTEALLSRKTEKALSRFNREYARLIRKASQLDSTTASQLRQQFLEQSVLLQEKLKTPTALQQYIPRFDSLSTSLNFLQLNPGFLSASPAVQEKLRSAMSVMQGLKAQLQKAQDIKAFLQAQRQQLKQAFERLGLVKELRRMNKEVYYYARQVQEVKEALNDPRKLEKKALELLSKSRLFRDFMRKNSLLASLFRLPASPEDPANLGSLAGLQTRAQVNALIQQQISSGGPNAAGQLRENLQAAQGQLNQLKDRVLKLGGGSSDMEMPEGFKPNNQRTKTFWQRLEYGSNVQSQRASSFFPVTTDLGLSLGYKLNDKSVIGLGASYKIGWGRGWNNIRLSSEGVGLRSFVDIKLKGSFWISGGYEQNYRTAFNDFDQLRNLSSWQQSGLIGISKVVSLKTKIFKKTRLLLLWDMLSYQQVPRTQPLVFRVGYNF